MIRARIPIAVSGLLVLGVSPAGCHHAAPVRKNAEVGRVIRDTVAVVAPIKDTSVVPLFKDTSVANVFAVEGKTFKLQTPGQRQSLRAMLRKERALWQARKPHDYRYLLRVGCFCPGTRGWLLIEVRNSQPLRAWDKSGSPAPLTDWNTLSIDGLYDNLERTVDKEAEVQIAFDPHWHFPRYLRTVALPGPDAWSIVEARALRPTLSSER
jgi:hypothetical protein